jgi:hypothetical protein
MTDANELCELEQRIARLPFDEQLHLFERVLAGHRRAREETITWMRSSQAAYLEAEKRQRETNIAVPPEATREAG